MIFYLMGSYNPNSVEFILDSRVDYQSIELTMKKFRIPFHSLNLVMNNQQETIIATSGMDMQFKDLVIAYGDFYVDPDQSTVVIGDRISDHYFQTANSLGRRIVILGEMYEVVGVIQNSGEIYIPYSKEFQGMNWDKAFLKFQASPQDNFNVKLLDVQKELAIYGIRPIEQIIYQDQIQSYKNYSATTGILILLLIYSKYYSMLYNKIALLWKQYQTDKREIEWYLYIQKRKKELLHAFVIGIGGLIVIYLSYRLLMIIRIPQEFATDNPFSPRSYWYLIQGRAHLWLQRVKRGMDNILLETTIWNTIMISVMSSILLKWTFERGKIGKAEEENRVDK